METVIFIYAVIGVIAAIASLRVNYYSILYLKQESGEQWRTSSVAKILQLSVPIFMCLHAIYFFYLWVAHIVYDYIQGDNETLRCMFWIESPDDIISDDYKQAADYIVQMIKIY